MSLYGQKGLSADEMEKTISIDSEIYHLYGVEEIAITKPSFETAGKRYTALVLHAEAGPWRVRPGDQVSRTINAVNTANATDTFTITDHGFTDGAGPYYVQENNTLPTGLTDGDIVYIKVIDANDFQLSLTSGGDAIDITTDGVSTNTITGFPGTTAAVAADRTDGFGSFLLPAGERIVLAAPDVVSVKSFAGTDALTYWWV